MLLAGVVGSKADAGDGDNDDEMLEDDDDGVLLNGTDMFTEILASETYSAFKNYLIDETLLV